VSRSSVAADCLYFADLGVRDRVAVGARRELEEVDHQLQRVVDPLVCGTDQLVIDVEADPVGCPLGGVRVPLRGIEVERDLLDVVVQARVVVGFDPDADTRLSGSDGVAEELCDADLTGAQVGDCSSKPTSQKASMQVGSGPAWRTASTSPKEGVYRRRVGCGVLTARSGRCRCWPIGEPRGPAKVPVWMLETRISPSSMRQAGWPASMRRRRTPASSS
jgi:hypothetical protein